MFNESPYALTGPALVKLGYSAIPIMLGEKRPDPSLGTEWERFCERLPTEIEIDVWSKRPFGVGVALGAASGGLAAIDVDSDNLDVTAAIESRWPSTVRKAGRKGYTAFYWASPAVKSRSFKFGNGDGVDLLCHGRQTVLPPTIHPTGVAYRWLTVDTLAHVTVDNMPKLPDNIADLIAEALAPFGYEAPPENPDRGAQDSGSGDWRDVNAAALARPAEWAPDLGAKRDGSSWRLQATWRNGDGRNVSIHANGIKDWAHDVGYSPIDLVAAALGKSAGEAKDWIEERLGMKPEPVSFTFGKMEHVGEAARVAPSLPPNDALLVACRQIALAYVKRRRQPVGPDDDGFPVLDEELRKEIRTFVRHTVRIESGEPANSKGEPFKPKWLHEIVLDIEGAWLVKKLFPRRGVVSWYGDTTSFKTFLLIYVFYCAALGKEVAGRKVRDPGPVVYIAAEDDAGVETRSVGYHMANEKTLPPRNEIPFSIIGAAPNLGTIKGDVAELAKVVEKDLRARGLGAPAAVAIDTLNQTLGDADENGVGMQAFMTNALAVARHFDCCVFAVNHVGHSDKGRERGGSAIMGNADVRVWVERVNRDPAIVNGVKTFETVLHVVKVKNGEDGFDLKATLREFPLGKDSDGDEVTTLVVDSVEDAGRTSDAKKKAAPREPTAAGLLRSEFLATYHRLASDVDPSPGLDGRSTARKVKVDAIRDQLKSRGFLECDENGNIPQGERTAFRKAKAALTKTGAGQTMVEADGLIWILHTERAVNFNFSSKDS